MTTFKQSLKQGFCDFFAELIQKFHDDRMNEIEWNRFDERQGNIAKAAFAMIENGLSDTSVIQALQKHFDLRASEAQRFVNSAHYQSMEQ